MSAFDYSRPQATAAKLIERYGFDATLRRLLPSGTGHAASVTAQNAGVRVVVTDYQLRDRDGTAIRAGDKKVLLSPKFNGAALTFAPEPDHKLIVSGSTYSIVAVDAVAPGGVPVLYIAQCRL